MKADGILVETWIACAVSSPRRKKSKLSAKQYAEWASLTRYLKDGRKILSF
jgi:hypothetical protein